MLSLRSRARTLALCLLLASPCLTACTSSGSNPSIESAEAAYQAQRWSRAAELWYGVHLAESVKTPEPYLMTALSLYRTGDVESACEMFDQGLVRFPYDEDLLAAKGEVLEESGFQRAAEGLYARLCAVDPSHVEGLEALARVRLALDLERAAEEPLERLVELDRADAETWASLGRVRLVRGERVRAFEDYRRAIELGCARPEVLLTASQLARDLTVRAAIPGAGEEALEWTRRLTEAHPQYEAAFYLRGRLLNEAGRRADAVEALRRAAEIDPGHVEALTLLARLHAEGGEDEAARRIAERALDLETDPARRRALLSLLD